MLPSSVNEHPRRCDEIGHDIADQITVIIMVFTHVWFTATTCSGNLYFQVATVKVMGLEII